MLKLVAVATLGWSLAICVGNACAVEMSMPTGDYAHGSGGGSGEVETATATARNVGATGAMRDTAVRDGEADAGIAARDRMPDTAVVTRSDNTHAAVGADAAAAAGAGAHRARHNAHWQSLLPGVMK
jgi:hypothetical protein